MKWINEQYPRIVVHGVARFVDGVFRSTDPVVIAKMQPWEGQYGIQRVADDVEPVLPPLDPFPQYLLPSELPSASTTVKGMVELATPTETTTGTSVSLGVTPAGMVAAIKAQLGNPTSEIGAAGRAAYASRWQPNTLYPAGFPVLNPTAQIVTALADFTSGASYDPTKWSAPVSGTYGRRRMYDVREYLGNDDFGAAVNRALAAAKADAYGYGKPGQVIIPPGSFPITTAIVPVSGVDLIGSGWGKTVLRPQGAVCALRRFGANNADPLTDVLFADFEIDGSEQANGTYIAQIKGADIHYALRCTFEHLYVHDTFASGLGLDYLVATRIHDCYVDRAGRANDGSGAGGNGIGIGTGAYTVEDFTVSDSRTTNCGRFGIMTETQDPGLASQGGKIIGCHAQGNQYGLVDCGMGGTVWTGNTTMRNTKAGFAVNIGTFSTPTLGKLGLFANNIVQNNGEDGIVYDATAKQVDRGYRIHDNVITNNAGAGVRIALGSGTSRMISVRNNEIGLNGSGGVMAATAGGGAVDLTVEENDIYSNTADGIKLACNVTRGKVSRNRTWGVPGANAHTIALNLPSGFTYTEVTMDGNDFHTGAGTAVSIGGGLVNCPVGPDNYGWTIGAGAPAAAAPVGTLYRRIDGGAATTLYVKESGTGTSGWVPK